MRLVEMINNYVKVISNVSPGFVCKGVVCVVYLKVSRLEGNVSLYELHVGSINIARVGTAVT